MVGSAEVLALLEGGGVGVVVGGDGRGCVALLRTLACRLLVLGCTLAGTVLLGRLGGAGGWQACSCLLRAGEALDFIVAEDAPVTEARLLRVRIVKALNAVSY